MSSKLAVRDAAATCQRELSRVAAELEAMGDYPSTKDMVKQLQALVDALQRSMRESAD